MGKTLTSTNYLSPEDFKKMVDAIPLVTEYNKSKLHKGQWYRLPDPKKIQVCAWIQYCHALRVTEGFTLKREDFDFNMAILSLNYTKTGYERCKCSKWKKTLLLSSDKDCLECQGLGKYRIQQITSIPPDLPQWVKDYILQNEIPLKGLNRQLIWTYYKKACVLAGLDLAERQKRRTVKGAWTHLLRKSRSKLMKHLGADREMRMLKLRHAAKDAHDAYDMPDINALIEWERENIKPLIT